MISIMKGDLAVLQLVSNKTPNLLVDFLPTTKPGIHMTRFRRVLPSPKGGGVFSDNPLSDGREMVQFAYTNGIIEMDVSITGGTQDGAIAFLGDLVKAMNRARDYTVNRREMYPVFLRLKAPRESNTTYALVKNIIIPELGNYYHDPFGVLSILKTLDKITVHIEHEIPTENPPGEGTAIEVGASEIFTISGTPINYGNTDYAGTLTPTTANEVYIANKRNTSNLSAVYRYNDTASTWLNLQPNTNPLAGPFHLFTSPYGVGDAIYFGIDTSLSNSGEFWNLVFDLDSGVGTIVVVFELYNGSTWVSASITDKTDGLKNTGVNSVAFHLDATWATVNLQTLFGGSAPSITGYWMRARIGSVGATPSDGVQQNRRIYSVVWPYAQLDSEQISGDIRALARMVIENVTTNILSRFVLGTRSLSRGEEFTAYINVSDEQNPSGISVSAVSAESSMGTYLLSPTGRAILYEPTDGQVIESRATITLDDTILEQYYGTFHMFLRMAIDGAGSFTSQIVVSSGSGQVSITNTQIFSSTGKEDPYLIIDYGEIDLPLGETIFGDGEDEIKFDIQIGHDLGSGTPNVYMIDLILIPSDEWIGDFNDPVSVNPGAYSNSVINETKLDVDSIYNPKSDLRAVVRNEATGKIIGYFQPLSVYPASLERRQDQRLWALSMLWDFTNGLFVSSGFSLTRIQMERNQRYLSLRGNQ